MNKLKKTLSQAIQERRATPSFDGTPIPAEDLRQILEAGLHAPSGYNMQPWRFVVVQSPEQKKRLRAASFNQGKVEEASAVIVACGDADGWRRDLDLMLELGRKGGMPESYAAQAQSTLLGFFRERLRHDLFKLSGNFRKMARQRRRLSLKNRDNGVAVCGRRERTLSGDHFIDHHAQAPNI